MTSPDIAEDRAEAPVRNYVAHTRLSLIGTVGPVAAPVEAWSMNLNLERTGSTSQAEADAMWNICSTWFSNQTAGIHPLAQLRTVKVSDIGPNGKLIGNAAVHNGLTAGASTAGQLNPPQVALVMSLGTGLRGGRNRGRVYLPLPALVFDASFALTEPGRGNAESTFVTFLQTINAQYPGQKGVIVASSKAVNTKVTTVRCGKILDTIRSRRTKLKELYDTGVAL